MSLVTNKQPSVFTNSIKKTSADVSAGAMLYSQICCSS
jgi:hypothetical protein